MSELVFVTTNNGKFHSAERDLAKYGITLVQRNIEIPELRTYDFREIAKLKAVQAFQQVRSPLIVNDAGFFMNAYGGFPRTYVNFALETLGLEGIHKLFNGTDRKCEFRQAVAYLEPGMDAPEIFETHVPGTASMYISDVEKPNQWSPLWRIFVPQGQSKTLADMSDDEYNSWVSTRGKSVWDLFGESYISR